MLFFEAVQARKAREQARSIQAFAIAYSGCKTEEGKRAMERTIEQLRQP